MTFKPFVPPPPPPHPVLRPKGPAPPPPMHPSQLPTFKRGPRKWPWVVLLVFLIIFAMPIGMPLAIFWVLAVGIMPHVAAFQVITGTHR